MALRKYSCYYEDRQLDQMSALAELDGRDVSKILRELADDYIDRHAHKLKLRRSFGGGALMKRLGGEVGDGTVLFFGVVGFASLVENLNPEETGQFLNRLYREVGEVALAHGGRVVKFMGDGGLLFFEGADHAMHGAESALALTALGRCLPIKGGRGVQLGVGAASGSMLIGHFGHEQFFQFDVVGETVNLGFGLKQLLNGHEGIVVSQSMRDVLCDRYRIADAGETSIPGLAGRKAFRLEGRR